MMVVYLDLAFFLNSAADALALYVTARLAGLPVRRLRILAAAVLGGAYGAACLLPPLAPAAGFLPQAAVAAGLTLLAFGRRGPFLRRFLLFYLLCCTLGGAMTALSQLLTAYGGLGTLARLNWKVFSLSARPVTYCSPWPFAAGPATPWRGSCAAASCGGGAAGRS